MFEWFKELFNTSENSDAESRLQALPLTINAPEGVALQRALGRLLNLYSVKNPTNDVLIEIERFKLVVARDGYAPPDNYEQTEQLVRLTRE